MKKLVSIFFVVILFCSLSFSQNKKAEVFFNGGISLPLTPEVFSDYWTLGYGFGGGAGYRFSPNISGNVAVSYNSMPFDEDGFLKSFGLSGTSVVIDGGAISTILVTANVKFSLAPRASASPYLLGGFGFFNMSANNITVSYLGFSQTVAGPSEGALGAIIGAGVDIPVSPTVAIFVEVDWGMGFTEGDFTGYVPAKAGLLILL